MPGFFQGEGNILCGFFFFFKEQTKGWEYW